MPVIEVDNVWKKYRVGMISNVWQAFPRLLKRRIGDSHNGQDKTLWALRGVDFQVERGEVVGFIGRNGSGKTTLLRILCGVTRATQGHVAVRGLVAPLIELGAGFQPELSGRENIYLNGAMLGMGRRELRRKFDEIVAFSELEKFMDTPVKKYSSGMIVRLGFSIAVHLEPDVLLVDEVLSVGDSQFYSKCLVKVRSMVQQGVAIVLVTHNMFHIQTICDRCLCLDEGRVVAEGTPLQVIGEYRRLMESLPDSRSDDINTNNTWGEIREFKIFPEGELTSDGMATPMSGMRVLITAEVRGEPQVRFYLRVSSPDSLPYFTVYSPTMEVSVAGGKVTAEATVARLSLLPGEYRVDVGVTGPDTEGQWIAGESIPLTVRGKESLESRFSVFWNEARWDILQQG